MADKRVILRASVEVNELVREYAEAAGINAGQAVDQLVTSGYNRLKVARESEAKRRAERKKAKK